MEKIAIRFIKLAAPYNAGEIAGFDLETARHYVKSGVAVFINDSDNGIQKETIPVNSNTKEITLEEKQIISVLSGSKQDILEKILENDEFNNPIVSDIVLGDMLFFERQGKNRKGVLKIIEDVSFDRIKNR